MKKLITLLLTGCMSIAVAGAYAADMKKDEMKKDAMTTTHDGMKKNAMAGDGMKKAADKSKSGEMGGAMKKDDMGKGQMSK